MTTTRTPNRPTRAAKKKPVALATIKKSTEEQREELRKEVADWYYTAKSLVDHIYHQTWVMACELNKPDSPLLEFLDHDEVGSLAGCLDQASSRIADIVVDVGIPLPDPMSVVRAMR